MLIRAALHELLSLLLYVIYFTVRGMHDIGQFCWVGLILLLATESTVGIILLLNQKSLLLFRHFYASLLQFTHTLII